MMQPGLLWCRTAGCNRACRLVESLLTGYCEGCRLRGKMPEPHPEKTVEPRSGHPEFYAILDEMKAVHERKAADYGSDEDPLHNVRSGGEFANIPAWVAAMLRANDKMVRLKSLIKKGKLENESAEDSLMDIANYAILALILKREGGK